VGEVKNMPFEDFCGFDKSSFSNGLLVVDPEKVFQKE